MDRALGAGIACTGSVNTSGWIFLTNAPEKTSFPDLTVTCVMSVLLDTYQVSTNIYENIELSSLDKTALSENNSKAIIMLRYWSNSGKISFHLKKKRKV